MLARKLLAVPKEELDEQRAEYMRGVYESPLRMGPNPNCTLPLVVQRERVAR